MMGYPLARLREEVAIIAHHFHWPPDAILSLDHRERQAWLNEVAAIQLRGGA
jgi:hypothetical protein